MTARLADPATLRSGPVSTWSFAVRQLQFWLTDYRRTWRGSVISTVLNPLLYLGAMGLGLGTLIDQHGTASLGGVSYLVFLAPGLLAASAMSTGVEESTYPVYGSVKWNKTYQAAVAAPLRPADLFHGHLLFVTLKLTMSCSVFLAVATLFGAIRSPLAIAALPAAVLTGLAFAAPIESWTVTRTKDTSLAVVYRFGLIPLFLFSGTFFPVTKLPGWIQPIAYVTPLWHGVALCRGLSLGTISWLAALLHIGYLVVLLAAGIWAGNRAYTRRLYV
jgi:lipooligosaccharide transport system permease protein